MTITEAIFSNAWGILALLIGTGGVSWIVKGWVDTRRLPYEVRQMDVHASQTMVKTAESAALVQETVLNNVIAQNADLLRRLSESERRTDRLMVTVRQLTARVAYLEGTLSAAGVSVADHPEVDPIGYEDLD